MGYIASFYFMLTKLNSWEKLQVSLKKRSFSTHSRGQPISEHRKFT